MLVQTVVYTFPPERADEAARLLTELRNLTREEPGCQIFDVNRSLDDSRVFLLYEVWDDQAALDWHLQAEHFIRLGVNGFRTFALDRTAYRLQRI